MSPPIFKTARQLANKANAYFRYTEGKYHMEKQKKVYTRKPEPPAISAFALFVGFNSREDLDEYELNGVFGYIIGHSRLKIEAVYEKQLHKPSPSGAIFAIKNLWRKDKTGNGPAIENLNGIISVLNADGSPLVAASEDEVVI